LLVEVYISYKIGVISFLLNLLDKGGRFGGFDFALFLGGAIGTHAYFIIVANIFAHPLTASLALIKQGFDFRSGLGQRIVVGFATH
jgi:hypothetical protein